MSGFRPRLAPTLITLPVVLLCLALGAWQVERLHWKERLIAQRATALAAPPTTAPQDRASARALEFHHIVATGKWLGDKVVTVHAIGRDGQNGFDVLSPLREAGGRIILINRGFVPADVKGREASAPAGPVRVSGRVRLPPAAKPGWFRPDNMPDRGEWFWIDLPAIAATLGIDNVAPFYIDADVDTNSGGWPKAAADLPALPNNHLQYAITWFSLATAALVIYFLSQWSAGGEDGGISGT